MKRRTWLMMVLTLLLVMQYGATQAVAASGSGSVLLDPRDGMYFTRIINLTGEQLSIAVANDPTFANNKYANLYSTGFSTSGNALNNQQNVFAATPIKLDTLLKHKANKSYAIAKGNAYWEGMINLCPLIPASNENNSYSTYSGHFSQGQRLTLNTVNNPSSILNGAYIQLGYEYSSKKNILWGKVFDFAFSSIKDAAGIIIACEDGDVEEIISSGVDLVKSIADASKTNPVTPSLNSATKLTTAQTTTQTSKFTNQVTKNYAQATAFFASANAGVYLGDSTVNNQINTLASTKQLVVTLTAADNTVRYFTAPAYNIYIKNVQAAGDNDINECTIAVLDGWIYNLAAGMSQYSGTVNLQNLNLLQLMYYAGSATQPAASTATTPAVIKNVPATPVKIIGVKTAYIGG